MGYIECNLFVSFLDLSWNGNYLLEKALFCSLVILIFFLAVLVLIWYL
jgi:hypothetical protein